jgi:cell division GTPase FtsZ
MKVHFESKGHKFSSKLTFLNKNLSEASNKKKMFKIDGFKVENKLLFQCSTGITQLITLTACLT